MLPQKYGISEKNVSNISLASSADFIQQSEMNFRDDHAIEYDTLPAPQAQLEMEFVLDELKLAPYKKHSVLDLGCGTGKALLHLIPHAAALIGIDFSLESLYRLKSKLDAAGYPENVHLIHGDATHPSLRKGSFDVITCIQLLQAFPDRETRLAVLTEAHRMAKPGARFVLSVFHYSLLKRARARTIKDPAQDVYEREGLHLGELYYHNYTGKEIAQLLDKLDLKY